MFDCSHTFSVDFLECLLKRRHLKESASKFTNNKDLRIQYNNDKAIDSTFDFLTNYF